MIVIALKALVIGLLLGMFVTGAPAYLFYSQNLSLDRNITSKEEMTYSY